jgi:hypothetical protein
VAIVSLYVRAWIGLNVYEANFLVNGPSVEWRDLIIVVRRPLVTVLAVSPCGWSSPKKRVCQSHQQTQVHDHFLRPYPIVLLVENRLETIAGHREESGAGP